MIPGYSDHAANERTFLAWVRTGIAVIAFGFVIEKFNLFVLTVASSTSTEATQRLLERLQGPFGRYDGHALIFNVDYICTENQGQWTQTQQYVFYGINGC